MKTKVIFYIGKRKEVYYLTAEQVGEVFRIIDQEHLSRAYKIDVKSIADAVCGHFGISSFEEIKKSRKLPRPYIRQVFYYIASRINGLSAEKIGKMAGGYNRTTVIHGRDKIKENITGTRPNQSLIDDINTIKNCLIIQLD